MRRLLFAWAGCGLLAGCNTTPTPQQARIASQPAAYAQLTPVQQKEVVAGNIDRNYTFGMVYLALGMPDRVDTSADGQETQWSYKNYYANTKVMNAPLFPAAPPRGRLGSPLDAQLARLGPAASLPSRDAYARATQRTTPRGFRNDDRPPLPSVDLELFFVAGKTTEIKIIR
jgi:hypothetical protein